MEFLIQDIILKTKREMIQTNAKIEIEDLEIKMMMDDDDLDMSALKSKMESVAKNHAKIRYLMVDSKQTIQNILTSEQKELMKKLKFRRHGSHRPCR